MDQVILNLVINACDAMPTGGQLRLETSIVQLSSNDACEHAGAFEGAHVIIAVSDTGTGMDQTTQARVFEPFFSTKEPGKGTGLGLSIVFDIVEKTGGHIRLHSAPGVGTSFKVYIPQACPELEKRLERRESTQ
jgi:signal transduction histidine kinase